MLIVARVMWEAMVHDMPRTREGYNHLMDLQTHLTNANGAVVLAVMIWWIVCLWIDEPGATAVTMNDEAIAPAADDTADTGIAKPSDPESIRQE